MWIVRLGLSIVILVLAAVRFASKADDQRDIFMPLLAGVTPSGVEGGDFESLECEGGTMQSLLGTGEMTGLTIDRIVDIRTKLNFLDKVMG